MSFPSFVLKYAAPLPKIESFKRYLFLGPHPDDIEIGAGASVARLAAQGKKICFLICTDGRYGTEFVDAALSPDELAARRREEAIRSAALLGVSDVRFLNLSDGGFYSQEELRQGIASVIGDFQPDILFAPDPAPISEQHPDHLSVGRAAGRLAVFAYNEGIMAQYGAAPAPVKAVAFYMTARPTRFVGTTGFLTKQLAAIDCHRTQFPEGSSARKDIETYLRLRAFSYGVRSHHGTAEGFRMLGSLHMHCLPEADK